jgi:Uma2 family endonuclease
MTLEGFRDWATSLEFPSQIRAAFIDMEVYLQMSNEDPETHVDVRDEIVGTLRPFCREEDLGKLYGDGVLVTNVPAGASNNPDGVFYFWKTLESGRVQLVPRAGEEDRYRELAGTPDWVLELVSDSSEDKDTEQLYRAYHRAGIPEYWLVDARGEEIVFRILHHRKKGYAAAAVHDGWQKSKVFGREFRLTRKRTRLNLWQYTLEMR